MTRYSVSVPATTANLGPGYDSFGLALGLRNEFHAEPADEWSIEIEGEGADELARDESNLVVQGMQALFDHAGRPNLKAAVRCVNAIPLGSGLGSSSTALVAGGKLGCMIVKDISPTCRPCDACDDILLSLLTDIEGHPDNIAPALFGGFTICWEDESPSALAEGTHYRCERFPIIAPIAAIIVPSKSSLATNYARSLLPEMIPHKDASFNIAHAGLLAAALTTGRVNLLEAAMKDKLHQPYRTQAVADFIPVRDILKSAGVNSVALSGAGPTIIAFVAGKNVNDAVYRAQELAAAATDQIAALGTRLAPIPLAFAAHGAVAGQQPLFGN